MNPYWKEIKTHIIPKIDIRDDRIQYLIEQIDTGVLLDIDIESEISEVLKKHKRFSVVYMLVIYHYLNYIKNPNEHYSEILELSLSLHK